MTKSDHLVADYKPNIFSQKHDQIGFLTGLQMLHIAMDQLDKQFIVWSDIVTSFTLFNIVAPPRLIEVCTESILSINTTYAGL